MQGFRLVIQDYVLEAENVDEELTLDEELIFLEKSWYVDLFNKKGDRNLDHPHFQTTPLKMITRLKAARLEVGGIPCNECGKKFKNQKTLEQHIRRYH